MCIRDSYYHSHETGGVVKRIDWGQAPRSLYSRLPRRFCFEPTPAAPRFLQTNRGFRKRIKKAKNPYWYKLTFCDKVCPVPAEGRNGLRSAE